MDKETYDRYVQEHAHEIEQIKQRAHKIHADVNQHYDKTLPYSVHLDSVADMAMQYAYEVCQSVDDILPVIFGAYFHDSIEDARLTYNNTMSIASEYLDERGARLATEIVYALTNEKGRTRAERANDRYYVGIRTTPYAPLCKFADRLANATYSASHPDASKPSMKRVYANENAHFMAAILPDTTPTDPRLRVPQQMVDRLIDTLK